MKQSPVTLHTFRCTTCGAVMTLPKKLGRLHRSGHVKTMYCYVCRRVRDFTEEAA